MKKLKLVVASALAMSLFTNLNAYMTPEEIKKKNKEFWNKMPVKLGKPAGRDGKGYEAPVYRKGYKPETKRKYNGRDVAK